MIDVELVGVSNYSLLLKYKFWLFMGGFQYLWRSLGIEQKVQGGFMFSIMILDMFTPSY
jgi:hypothetical protein